MLWWVFKDLYSIYCIALINSFSWFQVIKVKRKCTYIIKYFSNASLEILIAWRIRQHTTNLIQAYPRLFNPNYKSQSYRVYIFIKIQILIFPSFHFTGKFTSTNMQENTLNSAETHLPESWTRIMRTKYFFKKKIVAFSEEKHIFP